MRGIRLNRLLQLIALLRGPSSYNARRLGEHFGISRRNVHRDLAILELAGVPFSYDPQHGVGGGFRIRSDWWFPHVGLSDQECLDLAVLTRAAESHTIPLLDEVCTVRDKLLGTLPPKQQDLIRSASELFDVLGLQMADHAHCRPIMTCLQTALLKNRQVEGRYETPHQRKAVKVSLQPRRIFLAGQAWYLAAYDNKDGQTKLYRVARFKSLKVSSRPITIERNFSLREFLGNAWVVHRGGPRERDWHIEIEFSPDAAELVAETNWHHTQEIERRPDGSLILRAVVSGLDEVKWWILSWGPRARVLKPRELVQEVTDLVGQTMTRYTDSTPVKPEPERAKRPRERSVAANPMAGPKVTARKRTSQPAISAAGMAGRRVKTD